jgi:hypothetical protein
VAVDENINAYVGLTAIGFGQTSNSYDASICDRVDLRICSIDSIRGSDSYTGIVSISN